jgi:hypothetical protein
MKCGFCHHEKDYHFSKGSNGSGCVECLAENPLGDICYCFEDDNEPAVLVMKKGLTQEQLDEFKRNWKSSVEKIIFIRDVEKE